MIDVRVQTEYLDQLIKRYRNDVYDRYNIKSNQVDWELIGSEYLKGEMSKCDYIKENGNRCGHKIKNTHMFKNNKDGSIIVVGTTCFIKMFGLAVSEVKVNQLEKDLIDLTTLEEKIRQIIKNDESRESFSKKYTDEEKEGILTQAKLLTILPIDFELLLDHKIPLTENQYRQLKKNIENIHARREIVNSQYASNKTNENNSVYRKSEENRKEVTSTYRDVENKVKEVNIYDNPTNEMTRNVYQAVEKIKKINKSTVETNVEEYKLDLFVSNQYVDQAKHSREKIIAKENSQFSSIKSIIAEIIKNSNSRQYYSYQDLFNEIRFKKDWTVAEMLKNQEKLFNETLEYLVMEFHEKNKIIFVDIRNKNNGFMFRCL